MILNPIDYKSKLKIGVRPRQKKSGSGRALLQGLNAKNAMAYAQKKEGTFNRSQALLIEIDKLR